MLKDFDELKRQLGELSEVINKFKSETVQLRIVELIFGADDAEDDNAAENSSTEKRRRRKKRGGAKPKMEESPAEATDDSNTKNSKARKSGGNAKGAVATLNDLVGGNFFGKPKTINEIVTYCDHNLAKRYKASAFSGALARLTRNGVLERKKNTDGQYEYTKK